jgi:hypothetical protein
VTGQTHRDGASLPLGRLSVDDLIAAAQRVDESLGGDDASAVSTMLEEITRTTGMEAVLLSPDDAVTPTPTFSVPVAVGPEARVVAIIHGIDRVGVEPDAERLSFAHFLASVCATAVARDRAGDQENARSQRSDEVLLETLQKVRAGQDEVGNSLAVVLGWLRMLDGSSTSGEGSVGGMGIAIRRLEESQAAIAQLLRKVAAAAVTEHASDPVNVSAILRELGRTTTEGPDTWILANRTHLREFLESAADALGPEPTTAEDSWSLGFRDPGLLTTKLLMRLTASGGSLATRGRAQAAEWRLA